MIATTTTDAAAIAVAVVAGVAMVALVVAVVSLVRTLKALQDVVDTLRDDTIPLVSDMQETVRRANTDLERAGAVLQTAESIGATLDSASRLAYLAFSNPVVKAMAFGAGTTRAYRRLRRTPSGNSD